MSKTCLLGVQDPRLPLVNLPLHHRTVKPTPGSSLSTPYLWRPWPPGGRRRPAGAAQRRRGRCAPGRLSAAAPGQPWKNRCPDANYGMPGLCCSPRGEGYSERTCKYCMEIRNIKNPAMHREGRWETERWTRYGKPDIKWRTHTNGILSIPFYITSWSFEIS